MTHDLQPIPVIPSNVPSVAETPVDIVREWIAGRNRNTVQAYQYDLSDFARFVGAPTAGKAVEQLLNAGRPAAYLVVARYKANLQGRDLAASTINRRLAAIRAMLRLARRIGRIDWSIDVPSERVEPYRDTTGPPKADRDRLMASARLRAVRTKIGKRDLAIIMLLFNPALRRAEAIGLDLADVDLADCKIRVVRKGKTEPIWISMPTQARDAMFEWLGARGHEPGPVFVRLDRAALGTVERMALGSVNRMLDRLSRQAGLKRHVWPHGLRHAGITAALDLSDPRTAQKFSGHANLDTLMKYDDNRRDDAGKLAQRIADADDATT